MEKSKFFDYLLASNGPALAGFKSWLFQPGMEFNSRRTWWGEKQPRSRPHEGLDLCCFEDSRGQFRQVGPDLQIPATLAGKILKLAGDFLGESIYLAMRSWRQTAGGCAPPMATPGRWPNCRSANRWPRGKSSRRWPPPGKKTRVPPHLHLTLAWIPLALDPDRLDWQNLGRDPAITLIDPLAVLALPA